MIEGTETYRITLGNPLDYLDYRKGSGGTVEIYDIAVGSDRRIGIGTKLVNALIRRCLDNKIHLVWAITRKDNRIAQNFYEGIGFRLVAPLRGFYKDTPDGLKEEVDALMYGVDI